jgi:hypothetical protein
MGDLSPKSNQELGMSGQDLYLAMALVAFVAFGGTLFGVSIWVNAKK